MKALKPLRNRRVTLHVGYPKTATSSLQATLARSYDQCMDAGLCYPQALRSKTGYRNHVPLNNAAKNLTEHDFINKYQAVLTEAGDRDIIFSCEAINRSMIKKHSPLLTFLNQIHGAENVQVLISLRNVYEYADSLIAQFYKATMFGIDPYDLAKAGNLTPQGYLAAIEDLYGFPIYSYLGYFNAVKARFAENEIRLVSIEKNDLNEPYLDFFARYLGLECGFANPPKGNLNTRQSNQLLMCMREGRHHVRAPEFKILRPKIMDYCETQSIPDFEKRNRYLHINEVQRAEISRVVEAEHRQLLPLMDTPGAALFENKPVPPTEDIDLPDAMKKGIRQICAAPTPIGRIRSQLSKLRRKIQS